MRTEYLALALKNLRHRGLRSWLTLLGIVIGIAAVVSLISLGQGLQESLTGQFASLSADRLLIQNTGTGFGPPGSTAVQKLREHDLELIQGISGVERALARYVRIAKTEDTRGAGGDFNFLSSIPAEKSDIEYMYETFSLKTEEGKLVSEQDRGKILIGGDLARHLADMHGFREIRVGSKILIQGQPFEVAGILAPTGSFQFNFAIFMLEDDVKEIFSIEHEIDFIVVQVSAGSDAEEVAEAIQRKLRKDRNLKEGEEDFSVETPVQAIATVNTLLSVVRLVVGGIAALSLLVGGIGIANTMFTSVLERKKEIGTMKATGARNRDILALFVIESGFLGLVGGIFGAALGIALAYAAASAANAALGSALLRVTLSVPLLVLAIALTSLIGIVSGCIPAWQASRLHPVEALRA